MAVSDGAPVLRALRGGVSTVLGSLAPDVHVDSIFELDAAALWERNLRALVFDLDNTLGEWGFSDLDEAVAERLDNLSTHGFRLGFMSNHHGGGRHRVQDALRHHPMIWSAGKPRRACFHRMVGHLGIAPRQTAMVGDRLLLDVLGARRVGLFTIMVRPVLGRYTEGLSLRLQRTLEHAVVATHRWASAPTR